ncbi:mitochondrial ATPase inhibitor, IATP-domain-containing protein [Gigaspora rosea]|uniref:ATPase inhibitor, mitochondrial n=1 Tax=Gigaspora rosea TaxID=44941 RepID=A0A397UQ87_9GLOM|nr:mitochondrial ATPase inhibitor, IATP-domain-containing protein [Gigaspora rosea]
MFRSLASHSRFPLRASIIYGGISYRPIPLSVMSLKPRYFVPNPYGSDGHIRDSEGAFSKKEKAIEDQWIRAHDSEKLKKLRDELAKQKKKLEELEDDIEDLEEDINKKK